MRASIWISTYRRPEMLRRLLDSLVECRLTKVVLMPPDEEGLHDLTGYSDVTRVLLPDWAVGHGAGAPRAYAGAMALSDDYMVVMDDDVHWPKLGSQVEDLVAGLERQPTLCTVQPKFGFPPSKRLDDGVGEGGNLAAAVAIRVQALAEVGGYDPTLWRKEDEDLSIRLRLAGWKLGKSTYVTCNHEWYQPGGMSEFEARQFCTWSDVQAIRVDYSNELAQGRVVQKYPAHLLTELPKGRLRIRPKRLRELQQAYRDGTLVVDVNGARLK